jgi:hypothetical protein
LLLPLENQLPTGRAFDKRFLILQKDGTFLINPDEESSLKQFLNGRVSYLRSPPEQNVIYEGKMLEDSPDIPQFRLIATGMKGVQEEGYNKAFKLDTSGEKNTIYTNSRQAALFVFPDQTWGPEGLKKYTEARGKTFVLGKELVSKTQTVKELSKLSVKYAAAIETILNNPKKNIYLYSSVVNGSGAKLFCKILELYGYAPCTGKEAVKGKRYILLTGDTPRIDRLVKYYNADKNVFGEYCQIVVGSKKISEGFTFKNIQIEIIFTFHWNYTETAQALKRGIRYMSQAALQRALKVKSVPVLIKQFASVPSEGLAKSIDFLMVSFSKRKDISIRRMDRVIAESAFDCPLFYDRNLGEVVNSRECDYQSCEYKCDTSSLNRTQDDISTFELYYSNFEELLPRIFQLFQSHDSLTFTVLEEIISPSNNIQLLKALAYIIENNIVIRNRYKLQCFLREENNKYFLVDAAVIPFEEKGLFEKYGRYVRTPLLTKRKTLDQIARDLEIQKSKVLLDEIIHNPPATSKEFEVATKQLPARVLDMFIQAAVERVLENRRSKLVDFTLTIYEEVIYFPRRGEYAAIYEGSAGTKCARYQKGKYSWVSCKAHIPIRKERRQAINVPEEEEKLVIPEGVRYVGVTQEEKFCIQDLSKTEQKDKRRRTTGAVCVEAGWSKMQLIELIKELGLKENGDDNPKYWTSKTKAVICSKIRSYLEERGLVRKGKCGTSRKQKN